MFLLQNVTSAFLFFFLIHLLCLLFLGGGVRNKSIYFSVYFINFQNSFRVNPICPRKNTLYKHENGNLYCLIAAEKITSDLVL